LGRKKLQKYKIESSAHRAAAIFCPYLLLYFPSSTFDSVLFLFWFCHLSGGGITISTTTTTTSTNSSSNSSNVVAGCDIGMVMGGVVMGVVVVVVVILREENPMKYVHISRITSTL
jgi:hypothetical protein